MQQVYPVQRSLDPEDVYTNLLFEPPEDRPYVILNMVSSIDGKTTINGELRKIRIGSSTDRRLMEWIRLPCDMVVRGAETVRVNPAYTGVSDDLAARRQKLGQPAQPLVGIVSASCNLPLDKPLFSEPPRRPVVITGEQAPKNALAAVSEKADVLQAGDERVDPERALLLLQEKYGVRRLLLEGGPRLNYDFLRAGLVDEIFWTVAPKLIGRDKDKTMVEGRDVFHPMPSARLVTAFLHEDEFFLRYRILGSDSAARKHK